MIGSLDQSEGGTTTMSRSRTAHAVSGWPAIARLLLASCAALALLIGGLVQGAAVRAQDASPTPVECDAPELPPGTPTPQMEGSPAALEGSPVAVSEEGAEAKPEAGTPADEATAAEINAAVENYVACFNSGDPAKYVALETEYYWQENY